MHMINKLIRYIKLASLTFALILVPPVGSTSNLQKIENSEILCISLLKKNNINTSSF